MFNKVAISSLSFNPFTKIGKEWALITSGNETDGFNMMTVSWGGFGVLWGKDVLTVYIRPDRYTRKFFDENELFTVSFYDETYRRQLNLSGTLHGNKTDKIKEVGLNPFFLDGTTAFTEANLIFVCRKIYHDDLDPEHFDDPSFDAAIYPLKDYHRIFIGAITSVYEKTK